MGKRSIDAGAKIFAAILGIAVVGAFGLPKSEAQDTRATPNQRFEISPPGAPDMGPAPMSYHWQQLVRRANDYASFVREALPAASSGNADAQFAVYSAFAFCH